MSAAVRNECVLKILSFIIPAYNSEKFLEKCVGSMLSEPILDKLEILIVNDGSTDATQGIARAYCVKYPETVRLISQENKGHGGALNTGCSAAQGKYLKVIDADDWVETDQLPAFVRFLEQCSSDIVLTHHRTIDISTGEIRNWRSYPKAFGEYLSFQEVVAHWSDYERSMTFHGITYRREFYQSNARFLPEHVFYEDHEYAAFPCCRSRSIVCLDLFLYNYRIGDVAQSVSAENQLRRIGHIQTVIRSMLEQYLALPEGAGKQYAALKTAGLLLSYFTTVLLVNPDRKQGRAQGQEMLRLCKSADDQVLRLTKRKYLVFYLMNILGLDGNDWDRIRKSGLYNGIRRKHTFK